MQRFLLIVLVGFLTAGAGYFLWRFMTQSIPQPTKPIRLGTSAWEGFLGPDLEGYGPIGSVVRETIQQMGYVPQLSFGSWDVTLKRVHRREVHGAFPFIKSDEREKEFLFSDTILTFDYVLFYMKSRHPNPTVEDIRSGRYRFGKALGYAVWPELDSLVKEARGDSAFEEFNTSVDAFRALERGDIDFVPEGLISGRAILKGPYLSSDVDAFGYREVGDDSPFGARTSLHLIMRHGPASERFLELFDEQLDSLRETSLYRQASARMHGEVPERVELELKPEANEPYVRVLSAGGSGTPYLVPSGTRAVATDSLKCLRDLVDSGRSESVRCRVKLLNGPERGHVVFVRPGAMALVP